MAGKDKIIKSNQPIRQPLQNKILKGAALVAAITALEESIDPDKAIA